MNRTQARTEDGHTVVYEEVGEGPLVLLQHGFPDTPRSWRSIQAALADAGYRTVAPWLRGYHPDTRNDSRPYGPTELGEDLLRVLDALDEQEAVIVGHDWGAMAGYSAAAMAPERIRGLVTVAIPHPRVTRVTLRSLKMIRHFVAFKTPIGDWLARRNGHAYIDTLYRRWSPSWDGPERERVVAGVRELFGSDAEARRHALQYYRDFPATPTREMRARAKVPGLVFAGDEDWGGDMEPYLRSCEAFDAPCGVVIAEGAGHWAHLEAEERFVTEVRAFLDGLPS